MKIGDLVKFRNPLLRGVGLLVAKPAAAFWSVALGGKLVLMYAGDIEVISESR